MRILILSFYFEPDLSAGSFRTAGLIQALQRAIKPEDRIDVLTTQPNRYASYAQTALAEETRGQVYVRRFSLPAHRNGFKDQARAFVSYACQVLKATRNREYDLVFATSGRLFTAALGAAVAKRKSVPLFLDVRDIFVDTLKDILSPMPARLMMPIFRNLEKWTMRQAKHINLVSEGFLSYFKERYPQAHYSVIPNGIDDVFLGVDYKKTDLGNKKIVLYAGNIGEGQGLSRIIPGLAQALCKTHEFWIIGDGGQRKTLELAVGALSNVKIILPVSRAELLDLYKKSDILFLHLNDYPAFRKVLPSKLFEYAVTEKPIVAGVAGYAASFLRQLPGVSVFPPCDVEGGLAALSESGIEPIPRKEFVSHYRRGRLMRELAENILKLASHGL